jgi:hypothetical protein
MKQSVEYKTLLSLVRAHQRRLVGSTMQLRLPIEVVNRIRADADKHIVMDYNIESLAISTKHPLEKKALEMQFPGVIVVIVATNKEFRVSTEFTVELLRQQEILTPVAFLPYGPQWVAAMHDKTKAELIELLKQSYQKMAEILGQLNK